MGLSVGELFVSLGLNIDSASWAKGNKVIKSLAASARRWIAGEAVHSMMRLVDSATEGATHLISLAQAMGMTVQQATEWGYLAEQSGSNLKELSIGVNMFERNLRSFAEGRGSKILADRFREIGITSTDVKRALAGPEGVQAVLLKTADALAKMDPGRRATFTNLFGVRAGRAMLADLARGREGIEELFKRRRAMGELDQKQAMSLRDLGNRIRDLRKSWSALASTVIAELAPTLIQAAEGAAKWIAANKDLISGALKVALLAVKEAFVAIGAVVSTLADLIRKALGGDEGAIAIVTGLAAAILTVLVPALYAMAAPIVAASLPLIAIAAVVAAITYAILKWGPSIMRTLAGVWQHVRDEAEAAWDFISGLPRRMIDALIRGIERAAKYLRDKFEEVIDWIEEKLSKLPLVGKYVPHKWDTELKPGNVQPFPFAPQVQVPAVPASAPAGATSITIQQHVSAPIKIDGSKDPKATAGAINEHLDGQARQVARAVGGQVR